MRVLTPSLIVLLCAAVAMAGPAAGQTASPGDAWVQFRANPSLTGVSTSAVPDDLEPALDVRGGRVDRLRRGESPTARSMSGRIPAS